MAWNGKAYVTGKSTRKLVSGIAGPGHAKHVSRTLLWTEQMCPLKIHTLKPQVKVTEFEVRAFVEAIKVSNEVIKAMIP